MVHQQVAHRRATRLVLVKEDGASLEEPASQRRGQRQAETEGTERVQRNRLRARETQALAR